MNLVAIALLIAAWAQGWVTRIWENDVTHLSAVIAGVFAVGWVICTIKVIRCSRELNVMRGDTAEAASRAVWYKQLVNEAGSEARATISECLRSRLYSRISVIRTISDNLVILGLIGTVIGFIIALGGVDADSVANVDAIAPMISALIEGMSVALVTTLVGAVFHVWLTMCYQILATGTVNLSNAIIEQAEAPGFALPNDIL